MTAIIIIEILAILANMAAPVAQNVSLGWRAAAIVRDMRMVAAAAESAKQQRGAWPDERQPGEEPPELNAYLPPEFTFARTGYELDWDHWDLVGGATAGAMHPELAAITVVTHDARLAGAVARRLGQGQIRFTLGDRTTLVVSDPPVRYQ